MLTFKVGPAEGPSYENNLRTVPKATSPKETNNSDGRSKGHQAQREEITYK